MPLLSGSLSGLHLPSFSTNLVSTAALTDAMVTTTTHGGQRVSICTCTRTGRHLATFTRRPGSSLYTLTTKPPQTLIWHHHLGHPSLPRLRGMHSRLLVSGLPRSLPPLPPPLHRGAAARRSSLLLVSPDDSYPADSPHGHGILQSFTLPASPQKNGIADRRIGLVIEVARTSMIHAAATSFLWPFVVRYVAHQLNLWPRVSLPETLLTLRWMGKFGGSGALFYHPILLRALPSKDVMFDESVPFYHLFPYLIVPLPLLPLFLAPGPPPVDPLPPQGRAPSCVSHVDPLPLAEPVEVAVESGATRGAGSGGCAPTRAEPGGAEPEGAEPGCAESEGAESGGAEPRCTASAGGPGGTLPRLSHQREPLSSQLLREWFALRTRLRSGAAGRGGPAAGETGDRGAIATSPIAGGNGAGGARATIPRGAGVTARAGGPGVAGAAGPGGARTRGTGAAGAGGVGGTGPRVPGAGGTGAGDPGA
ncbi:unnamed protein product [Closterium sp. NIES-53]